MGTFLILLIATTISADTGVKANTYHPTFINMITQINIERAKHGLQPVQPDPVIMMTTTRHTKWMVRNKSLSHSQGIAEIAASGHRNSTEVVRGWMSRNDHKSIILGVHYKYVGAAGYAEDGRYYWCMQFSSSKILATTVKSPIVRRSAPIRYSSGSS